VKLSATVVSCALFLALSPAASAITWNVPTDAPTIQAGIDSASAGDTVIVSCGTYYEHDIVMKSGVTLRSETGLPDCVTIDADSLGSVFYCQNVDSAATIEGFTITRGYKNEGGGLYLVNSSPAIRNCVVSGNGAVLGGGGLWLDMGSPTITNCRLTGNSAIGGGGMCLSDCNSTISNCVVFDNSATWGGGGGLWLDDSSPTITGCTISGNSSWEGGGLSFCMGSLTLVNTIITFSSQGEAIYSSGGTPTLTCCDVYGNAGGDWTGCIAGQDTVNNNLWADPLFCEPESGDFSLRRDSPCAPDDSPAGCGLIGAEGVGCALAAVAEPAVAPPTALTLGPAIPNPFNPVTGIIYGIPETDGPSRVTMNVYDALGRRVTTLVDAEQSPGTYHVVWDGRDHKGGEVASGVYFYRICWNGKSQTRRMVLLR